MEFRLPELGEGVYEAELGDWSVKPGDYVRHGNGIAEVMTDKASMDLPAPFTGTIAELRAEPGSQINVGQVILTYHGQSEPLAETIPGSTIQDETIEGDPVNERTSAPIEVDPKIPPTTAV